jgi:hypothetical protein
MPVTSAAPVSTDARTALEEENFSAFASALEHAAGEDGFAGSLRRLAESNRIEKGEADRLASRLFAWMA